MMIPLFLLLIFISSSSFSECSQQGDVPVPVPGIHEDDVVIINNGILDTVLTVHCKSKDDDLGVRTLKYNESFQFSFQPNIWDTTLFFCGFSWDKEFHWFDIYKTKHRFVFHINSWIIHSSGPCLFNTNHQAYDYCYPWNADNKQGLQFFPALNPNH
ncbi:hypothetical protein CsatA_024588 [Cannabis sativa]